MAALPSELISQLVKVTNDRGRNNNDVTVYGTITTNGERNYVRLDGSDVDTPVETTVEVSDGDRVIVQVKDHTATVTGNTTDVSIGTKTANGITSKIEQTASEIRLEVADEVNGLNSKITQNAESITSVVSKQDEFSEFKQTVEGFSFMNAGGTVKISGGDINLTGAISFSDLSDSASVQNQINTANSNASDALDVAESAESTADNVLTTVNGITIKEGSKTYIDGEMLYTNSVYADAIHLGGALTVYQTLYGNTVGGYLGYDDGFNSDTGIGIRDSTEQSQVVCTNKAARLSYGTDSQVVANSGSVTITGPTVSISSEGSISIASTGVGSVTIGSDYIRLAGEDSIRFGISGTNILRLVQDSYMLLGPYSGLTVDLGSAGTPWNNAYTSTGTVKTSDRNKKNSIEDLPEKYVALFDKLRPVRFKLNDGTSGRYHIGYIAQEVEEAMLELGIDSLEFAGLVKDKDEDGNDIYMLRPDEFDAIRDAKTKQLETQLVEAYAMISELKTRLDNLEAKEVS